METRACILNEDIYLAKGADQLLEHELGHYPEQKQGLHATGEINGMPIHLKSTSELAAEHPRINDAFIVKESKAYQGYKIGMEFQTIGGKKNVADLKEEGLGCGTFLKNDENTDITADNEHDLEFITEVKNITADGKEMGDAARDANIAFNKLLTPSKEEAKIAGNKIIYPKFIVYKNGKKKAHPQATVGIPINKLYSLLDSLSKLPMERQEGKTDLVAGHTVYATTKPQAARLKTNILDGLKKAVAEPGVNPVEQLTAEEKGFLALMSSFIYIKKELRDPEDKSIMSSLGKNYMPVMPRTSPLDIFNTFSFDRRRLIAQHMVDTFGADTELVSQGSGYAYSMRITLKEWLMGAGMYRNGNIVETDNARWKTDLMNQSFHSISQVVRSVSHTPAPEEDQKNMLIRITEIYSKFSLLPEVKKRIEIIRKEFLEHKAERDSSLFTCQIDLTRYCYSVEPIIVKPKKIEGAELAELDLTAKKALENILVDYDNWLRYGVESTTKYEEAKEPNVGVYELRALENAVDKERWGEIGQETSKLMYQIITDYPSLAEKLQTHVPLHTSPGTVSIANIQPEATTPLACEEAQPPHHLTQQDIAVIDEREQEDEPPQSALPILTHSPTNSAINDGNSSSAQQPDLNLGNSSPDRTASQITYQHRSHGRRSRNRRLDFDTWIRNQVSAAYGSQEKGEEVTAQMIAFSTHTETGIGQRESAAALDNHPRLDEYSFQDRQSEQQIDSTSITSHLSPLDAVSDSSNEFNRSESLRYSNIAEHFSHITQIDLPSVQQRCSMVRPLTNSQHQSSVNVMQEAAESPRLSYTALHARQHSLDTHQQTINVRQYGGAEDHRRGNQPSRQHANLIFTNLLASQYTRGQTMTANRQSLQSRRLRTDLKPLPDLTNEQKIVLEKYRILNKIISEITNAIQTVIDNNLVRLLCEKKKTIVNISIIFNINGNTINSKVMEVIDKIPTYIETVEATLTAIISLIQNSHIDEGKKAKAIGYLNIEENIEELKKGI